MSLRLRNRLFQLGFGNLVSGRQQVGDAAGLHIAVHRVFICGGVVLVHFAVPRQGIGTSGKAAVEYGQFPVFPVVDLSAAGNYERQPGGFCRVGNPYFLIDFFLRLSAGTSDSFRTGAEVISSSFFLFSAAMLSAVAMLSAGATA